MHRRSNFMSEDHQMKIREFITFFLRDYTMGTITQENDDANRVSIVGKLYDEFEWIEEYEYDCVEKEAYRAYLDASVRGLYFWTRRIAVMGVKVEKRITEDSGFVSCLLIPALVSSLKRDFPSKKIRLGNLQFDVSDAVRRVNQERLDDRRR